MSDSMQTIAVLGAGTMGRGIAHVAALAGYADSPLRSTRQPRSTGARSAIERNLARASSWARSRPPTPPAPLERLSLHAELAAAVAGAGFVIEAAPEQMALKLDLFTRAAQAAPAEAIFATNTSALSVTEMAAASGRPERFIGMHFFNPVHVMRLIEIVSGLETSDETVRVTREVSERMGKEVVLINESPGFITSRINVLIGNEAFRMLQEGVASAEDIDKALKLGLNHPMGPFEMADLVGLDVRLSILEFLHKTLGEAYRPNNLHVQLVRAGRLGRKTGRGVYRYDPQGKRID